MVLFPVAIQLRSQHRPIPTELPRSESTAPDLRPEGARAEPELSRHLTESYELISAVAEHDHASYASSHV
jgi:hypothetical protein